MKTEVKLTPPDIQKLKKEHWKKVKSKFIEGVPKRFTIEVDGLEDNSKYYHPRIILNENLCITSQCDLETNHVYAERIEFSKKFTDNGRVYPLTLDLSLNEHRDYILNNFEKVESKLLKDIEQIRKLIALKNSIEKAKENIIYTSLEKIVDAKKIQDSLDSLYEVSEYLENKRLNQ